MAREIVVKVFLNRKKRQVPSIFGFEQNKNINFRVLSRNRASRRHLVLFITKSDRKLSIHISMDLNFRLGLFWFGMIVQVIQRPKLNLHICSSTINPFATIVFCIILCISTSLPHKHAIFSD